MTSKPISATHQGLLDASFAWQAPFAAFCRENAAALRRRPLLVPEATRQQLLHAANDRGNLRRGALAAAALQALADLEERRALSFVPSPEGAATTSGAVRCLETAGRLPPDLVVLSNDLNLVFDVEVLLRARPAALRGHVIYAEVDPISERIPGEDSWYTAPTARRQGVWPLLRGLFRTQADPCPPFRVPRGTPVPAGAPVVPPPPLLEPGHVLRSPDGRRWVLGHQLNGASAGGEGTVYSLYVGRGGRADGRHRVGKLYKPGELRLDRLEKLQLMITRRPPDPALCWPEQLLLDGGGRWRGYLMSRAEGVPLDHHVLLPDSFAASCPHWTRRHSVQLCLSLLARVRRLHDLNILLGDVNPSNILVVDERHISLVDLDSCQVEDHACPVGRMAYTHPDLLARNVPFDALLRTAEHEEFSLATLLFQILLPGQLRYNRQDGLAYEFPYSLDDMNMPQVPQGHWRGCWSHLSTEVKRLFLRTFQQPQKPPSLAEWTAALQDYRDLLADPAQTFLGPARGYDLNILPRDRFHHPDLTGVGQANQ